MEHLEKRIEILERTTTHSRFVFGISIVILAGILSVLAPLVIQSAPSKFTGPSDRNFMAPGGALTPPQYQKRSASSTPPASRASTTTSP